MPDITALKKPTRLRSGWINGIKELQVRYKGACPVARSDGLRALERAFTEE